MNMYSVKMPAVYTHLYTVVLKYTVLPTLKGSNSYIDTDHKSPSV